MRTLADIPIGGAQYRQIDRLVQEINGLAEILTGDATYHYREHTPAGGPDLSTTTDSRLDHRRSTALQGRIVALNAIRTGPVSAVERPISVLPDRLPGGRVVRARDIPTDEEVRLRRTGLNQRGP